MGIDRIKKINAKSFHAEMPARTYGKYLFQKHREEIERFFLSHDMLVPEADMEKACEQMIHDLFISFGRAIKYNVEVRVGPLKSKNNIFFIIKYGEYNFKNQEGRFRSSGTRRKKS
jgi:hypothetical protein